MISLQTKALGILGLVVGLVLGMTTSGFALPGVFPGLESFTMTTATRLMEKWLSSWRCMALKMVAMRGGGQCPIPT